jgi:phosphoribosyl 1,2-cyclic phosphodiesterase
MPFTRYGGHTTCFEVVFADGHRLIVDGGSGLLRLHARMVEEMPGQSLDATLLLTHMHWDHIQGLPFFPPVYQPRSRLRVIGAAPAGFSVASAVQGAIQPPWFPVRLSDSPAQITYEAISTTPVEVGEAVVRGVPLHHPGGVTGYRIEADGRSVVVATDVEAGDAASDSALVALAEGADLLVHDAQYTMAEWTTTRRGWGHSTWEHAVDLANAAGVGRLLLTSHDPDRTDDAIDAIIALSRAQFSATDAAREGDVIDL